MLAIPGGSERGIALSEARDSSGGDGYKWQETSYETDSSALSLSPWHRTTGWCSHGSSCSKQNVERGAFYALYKDGYMVNKGMGKGGREFREIGRARGRMAECIIDAATGSAIATHVRLACVLVRRRSSQNGIWRR